MMNWTEYFLSIAEVVRQKSKDPSSKIGAVLVGENHQIISTGYNGFPIDIDEVDPARWERPIKYQYVCHAELNAIALAARRGVSTDGATLYMVGMGPPTYPCTECAKMLIQAGIQLIMARAFKPLPENWVADMNFAKGLLDEAYVGFVEIDPATGDMS
jgi:dCMP deaminase